jgi:hypothetical protein
LVSSSAPNTLPVFGLTSSRCEDPCRSNHSIARQVAASSAPHLRRRFLWTGSLSARHDFWPQPLSVGTHPTVTTYKANTGKTPRFLRFTDLATSAAFGQLVSSSAAHTAARGASAIRANRTRLSPRL